MWRPELPWWACPHVSFPDKGSVRLPALRVIPRLDIKGPNLVKGVHLEGFRVLGKPAEFARAYYDAGADELLYMDAVASLYQRNSLEEVVRSTSREIFIPLAVGGGLRTVDDIRTILRAGADKVALNTAAIADPDFVRRAAREFGSSTIVISIEAIRQHDGSYECFTDCGREATGVDVVSWAVQVAELGAGEILLTSVDREGTGRGYDLELTAAVAAAVEIPVIASGGAGHPRHVVEAAGVVDAVGVASILHYSLVDTFALRPDDFREEGNLEFRQRGAGPSRMQSTDIRALKSELASAGVRVRP